MLFLESLLKGNHPGKTTSLLKIIFFLESWRWELQSARHIRGFCFPRLNQLQIDLSILGFEYPRGLLESITYGYQGNNCTILYYAEGQSSCNLLFYPKVLGHLRRRMPPSYMFYTSFSRSPIYNLSSLDALWKYLHKKGDAKLIKSRHTWTKFKNQDEITLSLAHFQVNRTVI